MTLTLLMLIDGTIKAVLQVLPIHSIILTPNTPLFNSSRRMTRYRNVVFRREYALYQLGVCFDVNISDYWR